ncbi:MAG: hypothetical protein LBI86_05850 [Treponema sp.]|jgi:hypothetical protein|nr:hypothetical protein [Treponema sp.]
MSKQEKLNKLSADFCSLNEKQQDYILDIMEALVFAKEEMANQLAGAATDKSERVLA